MLLDEMKSRLVTRSLVPAGYTAVKGSTPATPDKVIAIKEGGGLSPQSAFGGDTVEQPTVQIVVRGEPGDYEGPRTVLQAIFDDIVLWGAFSSDGVRYLSAWPLQSPFPLGRDKNDRQEVAMNLLAQREV